MMQVFHILVFASCCLAGAFAKTSCEEHRQRELASDSLMKFVPECTPDGEYASLQCFTVNSVQHCMCFSPDGKQINIPSSIISTCDCHSHRDRELHLQATEGSSRGFIPTCNGDGTYSKKQCNSMTGVCWCSDEKGNKISEEKKERITC